MKVTVMMVVHNGSEHLDECIKSVVEQTFPDFDFLIIDDGSTDETVHIIQTFKDDRIRIISNEHNYIASLNLGLQEARGEYIARMDADDIMEPIRLERQVEVLDSKPEISACMSWARGFGKKEMNLTSASGAVQGVLEKLLVKNIFIHPTTMLRRSFLQGHQLCYKVYPYAEDYKLWMDMSVNGAKFWIIPEYLLKYRMSNRQVSWIYREEQRQTTLRIKNEILLTLLNDEHNKELEALQKIYLIMEQMNERGKLSADAVRYVLSILSAETKMNK